MQGPVIITVEGSEQVAAQLNHYLQEIPELVFGELEEYAELILEKSRQQVPWETTHLMQTGTVEPDEDNPDHGIQVGYNTPYAARQHEDMNLHHPKPGTKAKYLEDPAMEVAPEIVPGIVSKLDGYFSAGIPDMTTLSTRSRLAFGNLGGRFA